MPLGVDGSDETLHDGLVTATTARGKLLVVALPAEGLAVLLVETLRPKVLATQRAEEVFGMPRTIQGPHHTLRGERGEDRRERKRERERERDGGGGGGESRRLVMQVSPPIWFNYRSNAVFFTKFPIVYHIRACCANRKLLVLAHSLEQCHPQWE